MLDIYEIFHNIVMRPPKLAYFDYDLAIKIAKLIPNFENFNLDAIIKGKLDLIVDSNARKINELYVEPVGFTEGITKFLHDSKAKYFGKQDEEEQ